MMVKFPNLVTVGVVHLKSFNLSKIVLSFGICDPTTGQIVMIYEQKHEKVVGGGLCSQEENKEQDLHDKTILKIPYKEQDQDQCNFCQIELYSQEGLPQPGII